jgi:Cof subfamily protein (haloacid dehalogenase superfamily)
MLWMSLSHAGDEERKLEAAFLERFASYIEWEAKLNQLPVKEVDNFVDYITFDVNKCLMTAPPKDAEVYISMLQEEFKDTLSIYRSEPYFIEIMPKDVNKATSLDHMLEGMGLTRENAICCGDGYNDISMIEYAGTGVAMGNAQPAVKDAADYITGTNDEDGLVEVIDKFIMKPEQA